MSKRYWIKLGQHFFESDEIKYLEAQQNGDTYIKIWLKMMLKCLKAADEGEVGFLRFNDKIPYTDELLSKVLGENIDHIRAAMAYFTKLGMIDLMENQTIYLEEVQKLIGKESESAERVRRHRAKKNALQCNKKDVTNVKCNDNTSININTSINKNINKDSTNFIPANSVHPQENELHKKICLEWYKKYTEHIGRPISPKFSHYEKSSVLCCELGNDEEYIMQCVNYYWKNYNDLWYYKKSHNFGSFASNIDVIIGKLNEPEEDDENVKMVENIMANIRKEKQE